MSHTLATCCAPTAPKRLLACDGGGILGLISVEILARLEADLRQARNDPNLVLADYFDFVCGTSTGALIACCISSGMSMDQIRAFYVESGAQMFERASILKRLQYAYDAEPLAKTIRMALNHALGKQPDEPPATLGDPGLKTLLMMVMRNHTTDSPWPMWNNPAAKYNRRTKDDGTPRIDCNLDLPLWQLARASTAAPTFFPPEVVTFAEGRPEAYTYVFVDGGVTTYNNPAFLAFQMATAAPYQLHWQTGVDKLLIVSVGVGSAAHARPNLKPGDLGLLDNARNIPSALMNAAAAGGDMSCRILGDCRHGRPIDREFGDMVVAAGDDAGPGNWTGSKLFAYVRYDPDVSQPGLAALGLGEIDCSHVQRMDSVAYIDEIQRVGAAYAGATVRTLEHLRGFV